MKNKNTGFHIKTDALDEKTKEEARILLLKRDEILKRLVEAGLHADEEYPYAYYVPTGLAFDCGRTYPMHSLHAIVAMARASYARAYFLDTDKEGFPELPQFCGGKKGFHRVYITDPFAQLIDRAIEDYREKMVKEGKARIVNGRFFKVA